MVVRKHGNLPNEGDRALLAIAGFRINLQTNVSVSASSEATYNVSDPASRRAVLVHLGAAAGDIRFVVDGTAAATDVPLLPERYIIFDVNTDSVIHLFNTTGGAIVVHIMELQ